MMILLLPLVGAVIIAAIGVALFIILPVKWAIAAALLCIMAIGGLMAMTDGPFH